MAARRINIMTGRALNILIGQVLLALHCTAGSRNNSVSLMPSPSQLQLHNVMILIVILIVTCSLTYKRILDTLTNTHMHTHRPHKGISSMQKISWVCQILEEIIKPCVSIVHLFTTESILTLSRRRKNITIYTVMSKESILS